MKEALLTFSTAQAVTTATETASTDYLDQLSYGDALGKPLWLEILVNTTVAASGGASNVTFKLQCDDNSSFSSPTTLWSSGAIAKASLPAGTIVARIPL